MKAKVIKIQCVIPGSIAEEAGIEEGDAVISINGERINDIFDYRYLIVNENLVIEIEKKNKEIWEVEIEKDEYEDLGIDFDSPMIEEARSCTNKCIFCFIDQLPQGMRDTLYFKDDDSRLSFLMGNYVTLTNMRDEDIDRIINYRMSPINVSVHTTNPELRVFMLKNKFAGNVMERIKKLVDAGITVNCQIVLCRGVNDGSELDRSISELSVHYPGINSVSVVPVGITRHRYGLFDLEPFDKKSALKVIEQVEGWQKKLLKKTGSRIVYLADEFYIMADVALPRYEEYEGFPQIENGVGLIAAFRREFEEYINGLDYDRIKSIDRDVSIVTGNSAYRYINEMAQEVGRKTPHIKVRTLEIKNEYFGENVTVTGLLTGRDIVEQLKGKHLGEELLISKSMLKAGEDLFLDNYSIKMLEEELKVKVTAVENTGSDFIKKILGIDVL